MSPARRDEEMTGTRELGLPRQLCLALEMDHYASSSRRGEATHRKP